MRAAVSLLFALLVVQASTLAGVDNDIPQTNRVILAEGKWVPSEQETQKGLAAVQAFLEKPTSTNPSDALKSDYELEKFVRSEHTSKTTESNSREFCLMGRK